jgi:hypothetical protein
MALRLPMSGGFESFSNVRDIPFVARHASRSREEVCKALKIPADKPVVLASFGGYGPDGPRHPTSSRSSKKYTVITTVTASLHARPDVMRPRRRRRGSVISINEESMYGTGIPIRGSRRRRRRRGAPSPATASSSECIANDTGDSVYVARATSPSTT